MITKEEFLDICARKYDDGLLHAETMGVEPSYIVAFGAEDDESVMMAGGSDCTGEFILCAYRSYREHLTGIFGDI